MRKLLFVFGLAMLLAGCRTEEAPTAVPTPEPTTAVATAVAQPSPLPTATPPPTPEPPTAVASPVASPTPAPSSTPAVYTVVAGDTAVAIAEQTGVSLAELQAVNPAVDLNVLQVGQALLLPETAVVSAPVPEGAGGTAVGDAQLVVGQLQRYTTPLDSIWFLGELRNDGTLPVEDAMIDLAVDGAVTTIWVTTPLVLPGETAPFGLLVPGVAASADASVRGGIATNTAAARYALLSVRDVQFEALDGAVSLAGVVVNETDTAVDGVVLTASFYSEDDRLSGYQILKLDEPLGVGASRPFRMTTTPPGEPPTRYTLLAIGLRAVESAQRR